MTENERAKDLGRRARKLAIGTVSEWTLGDGSRQVVVVDETGTHYYATNQNHGKSLDELEARVVEVEGQEREAANFLRKLA